MHIHSLVTDNCPCWISSRQRMAVKIISWPISSKECCQTWGSTRDCQHTRRMHILPSYYARLLCYRHHLLVFYISFIYLNEPPHDKTKKVTVRPAETPPSLIRVFTVWMKKASVLSYPLSAQRRLWSDWADAQADLSLCCVHNHFLSFVMRQLKLESYSYTPIFCSSKKMIFKKNPLFYLCH